MLRLAISLLTACAVASPVVAQIDGIEREPINYKTAQAENVVTALQKRIAAGQVKLTFAEDHGYLPSLLKELNVPQSSQILVFSKTSFQRERITPKTPRALYFNDDVYVGFCLRGDVLELSAADTKLGTAFYTLDQEPVAKPEFLRQRDNCLTCHASGPTGGVTGSPGALGVPRPLRACRSSPRARSARTTPARLASGGAGGTSPARTASRRTWATGSSRTRKTRPRRATPPVRT